MKMKILSILFVLVLSLILAACSAAATQTADESFTVDKAGEAPREMPAAELAAPPVAFATAAPAAQGGSSGMAVPIAQIPGQMVIKDARMDLEVENTDRAVDEVTQLAATQGGYIIAANTWFDGDQKFASISMGVPSGNFERTLTFLRAIGIRVLSETASGQDVTAEYNDLQIRLENLEATAARVRAFLEDAKTVEESLRINATLSELEGQINQIKGQMKFYEGRSAYSTIEVALNPLTPTPTITPTPTQTPTPTPWNPGATIRTASNSGIGLWQDIMDGLIWVCFLGWPLLLVGGIIWLIVWLVRRGRKNRAAALAAEQKAAGEAPAVQTPPGDKPPASGD